MLRRYGIPLRIKPVIYESFPDKALKGFDIGLSAGSPVSGWRISTFAHPITKRFDITFWSKKY